MLLTGANRIEVISIHVYGTVEQALAADLYLAVIRFVSMAPGYDQLPRYTALYNNYSSYIDAVNYQFYGEGLNTCDSYKARYTEVTQSLPVSVVGLSTQVSGDPNTITGTTFYNCVKDIKNAGNHIAGVYLWNADLSKQLNNGFATEKAVAAILQTG